MLLLRRGQAFAGERAVKTQQEILDRIHDEVIRLGSDGGHMATFTRGWIDALEWVLERDE